MVKEYKEPQGTFSIQIPFSFSLTKKEVKQIEEYCNDKEITKVEFCSKCIGQKIKRKGFKNLKELLVKDGCWKIIKSLITTALYRKEIEISKTISEEMKPIIERWENEEA